MQIMWSCGGSYMRTSMSNLSSLQKLEKDLINSFFSYLIQTIFLFCITVGLIIMTVLLYAIYKDTRFFLIFLVCVILVGMILEKYRNLKETFYSLMELQIDKFRETEDDIIEVKGDKE